MTKRSTKAPAPAKQDGGKTLTIQAEKGETESKSITRAIFSPLVGNAVMTGAFSKSLLGQEPGIGDAIEVVKESAAKVKAGDLGVVEDMLIAQATTLNAVFCETLRRAGLNMGEHLNATESYIRMAMKAQAQCRATLETLAEIKNPRPVAFVKQANIAHGPQQVNNGPAPAGGPLAHGNESRRKQSNELLGVEHGERLDTGTQGTTSGANPAMATLETEHRPKD